ncbi:hypothetical protein JCM21900_000489 [Sporobolomyces salmonicolor]
MSGPGQGRHPYSHPPSHHPDPQSVGSASSLFASSSDDDQQAQAFYGELNSHAHPGQSASPYPPHDMNTVFEEDEPTSSPEVGRNEPHWGAAGAYGWSQQHQADNQNQQQQYSGYEYSQQPQQQQQQQQGYDYSHAQQEYDQSAYAAHYDQQSSGHPQQAAAVDPTQQQQQWEPPYYPGYIYDAASNSYLEDPDWVPPSEGTDAGAHDQGHTQEGHGPEVQVGQHEQQGYDYGQAQAQGQAAQAYEGYGPGQANGTHAAEGQQHDLYAAEAYGHEQANNPYQQQQDSYAHDRQEQTEPRAPPAQDPYAHQADPYGQHPANSHAQAQDPYAEQPDPYAESQDPYAQQNDLYAQQSAPYAQPAEQSQEDPYAADSNPYAEEGEQADPFAQDSQDVYGAQEQQSQADPSAATQPQQEQTDPYPPAPAAQANPYAPPQPAQPPSQPPHDSYARTAQPPANSAYAPPAAAASRNAYSPPPATQQYPSFAAAYDAPPPSQAPAQHAQHAQQPSAPYDPYAPVPKQQRPRGLSSASQASQYDPYAAQQSAGGYGSQQQQPAPAQQPYDPYAAQQAQRQQAPYSTATQQQPQTHAPPQSTSPYYPNQNAAPPPSAFSPPPRSSSATSNTSSVSALNRRQQLQASQAPPRARAPTGGSAAPSLEQQPMAQPQQAAPALKAAAPPSRPVEQHQQQAVPPPQANPAAAQRQQQPAFDAPLLRSTAPAQRQSQYDHPPPGQPPQQLERAPPSHTQPSHEHQSSSSSTISSFSTSSYAPPPAGPSRASQVLPPSQRKPAPFGGVMQPPARRAPHQRGPSAFAGDSPYGALPTGPLTSMYEPPAQAVEQIKEEEEEEEEIVPKPEEQQNEEYVPSWMQATAGAPARPPFYASKSSDEPITTATAGAHDEGAARRAAIAADDSTSPIGYGQQQQQRPYAPAQVDALSDSFGKVSLNEPPRQPAEPPRTQKALPPPRQQPGAPPPPHAPATAAVPPPRATQPPPPRAPTSAPPPPRGAHPPRVPLQAAPLPSHQAPSMTGQVPQSPARQQQVPHLHIEAPSPEVRAQRRSPYDNRSVTPVPMSVVQEVAEDEQYQQEHYFGQPGAGEAQGQQQTGGGDWGMDDSAVFGESNGGPTGRTTPSTTYGGDWKAESEDQQGYDYISNEHVPAQQQQQAYDPYAPQPSVDDGRDAYAPQAADPYAPQAPAQQGPYAPQTSGYAPPQPPARESNLTSPVQQSRHQPPFASPPRSATQSQLSSPPKAHTQLRASPSAPIRADSVDSYAQYPAQGFPIGPYTAQVGGNLTAPAAYGSFPQQQQPYDPYAVQAQAVPRERSFSSEVADLGLDRRTAPVVSFGFGGRMLVVFPTGGRSSFGIDSANPYGSTAAAAAQPSTPSTVHIRKLAELLPPSDGPAFPGPIFLDGGKANAGKKRKEAMAWLGQRIDELDKEISYAQGAVPPGFGGGHAEDTRKRLETRLLLVKLVKVLVENEGKLAGSTKVDDAVRAILAPQSAVSNGAGDLPTADQLAAVASQSTTTGSAAPFVTYGVSPANLDEMSAFLLRGERREAVKYALDHKMWAHAFIIASCVDTDCWKDVTVEFLRSELTPSAENVSGSAEGREALRVAYSMFAGLGAESIHQFLPPRSLALQAHSQLLPPAPIGAASGSPNTSFDTETQLPEATLDKWRDTVGMIVANRTAGDSAVLTALGDALASNGWIEAAHICYLLSPQTSLANGLGSPGSRVVLIGSMPSPVTGIDLESVKLTELVEFAFSLAPAVKGHDAFVGFPHLQAFRLYHACALADAGHIPQALKYTEAIVNTLKLATKPNPFYHPRLVARVKILGERLTAAPGHKESGSWIARKVPRPTVNSLWSTFEGGFNKFIAGEGEPSPQQLVAKAEVAKQAANGQSIGPFSHYSSISPGSTSGTLSRAQSSTDLVSTNLLQVQPPARPSSATAPVPPILVPSSQSNPNKPLHSPGPPPVKRAPFKTHHARSSSLGAFAGYDFNPTAPPPWQSYTPPAHRSPAGTLAPGASAEVENELTVAQSLTASPSSKSDAGSQRPQFAAVDEQFAEDDSGFISPMAQYTPSVSPSPSFNRPSAAGQPMSHRRMTTAEELADLGIGNSKSKKPAFDTLDEELEAEEGGVTPSEAKTPTSAAPAAAASGKPDEKPTIKPSKSWLGGWFKREGTPTQQMGPGPIKANLGEQKSFYYDEKLKRWVNKSGNGGEDAPPAVVPPPRAATASPNRAMRHSPRFGSPAPPMPAMPPRSNTTGPPPLNRSATSADLRSQAPDFRPSSNAGGPPSRPPSAAGGPPPPRSAGDGTATPGGGRPAGKRKKPQYVPVAL